MKNKYIRRTNFLLTGIAFLVSASAFAQPAEDLKKYQEKYPGEPAIYVANEEHVTISVKKGELEIYSTTHEDMMLMQDNSTMYSDGSVAYSGWTPLEDISAKTLVPDGSKYKSVEVSDFKTKDLMDGNVFHDDSKEKTFYYPSIVKGSRMILDYTLFIKEPRFLPSFMFGSFCPIENCAYTITCPDDVELEIVYNNTNATQLNFTKTESKGNIIYSWNWNGVPKLEFESSAPAIRYYAPHLVVYIKSYMKDGKKENIITGIPDLYKYYYNFTNKPDTDNQAELKEIVDSLTKGIQNEEDKVKNIFYWVQDNIKYVAFEAGLEGFVPRHASTVCSKRYGDCKDMANILTTMLTMADIEAHLTWIGTRDIPYSYNQVPTPLSDNHMICAYKSSAGYKFLDATASYVPFGMPTPFIQGKEALIKIDKENYDLVKVPEMSPDKNLLEETIHLKLDGDKLVGKSTSHYTGYVDMIFTELFKNVKPADKKKVMNSIYEIGNNTFTLDTIYEENLFERDKEFYIHYTFNLKNYAKVNGDKIYINLSLDKDLSGDKVKDDRKVPVEEEYKQTLKRNVSFEIPDGYEVEFIPESSSYDNDMFSYQVQFAEDGNMVTMHSNIVVNYLMLNKPEFTEWNKMIKQMNSAYNEVVILKKK